MISREEYDKLVDEYNLSDSIRRKVEIIGLVNELLDNRNSKIQEAIEKYKESGQELPDRFKEVYYLIDVNKCRLVGDSPIRHHSMIVESCTSPDITSSTEQVTYYNRLCRKEVCEGWHLIGDIGCFLQPPLRLCRNMV